MGGGLLAVLLVAGGGALVAAKMLQSNIRTEDLTPMLGSDRPSVAPPNPDGGRPITLLVMGSDSREGANGFIGGTTTEGAKSDTTLVVHLAADRSWATGVSIPRDSMVEVPDCVDPTDGTTVPGSRRIFNDAFTTGGPACTIKTVESLTGLRIDHWVVVDFNGFTRVVDALGRIPICLPEPVDDRKHNIKLPAGRTEVDGRTALAYVRERYTLGDGSDLGRIDRQQAFLSSVLQKAVSADTLTNPARTYAVLDAVTGSLAMDPDLAGLPRLAAMARDVERIGLGSITFLTVPNGPDPGDPNRLAWTEPADTLWEALRQDRPVSTADTAPTPSASPSSPSSPDGPDGPDGAPASLATETERARSAFDAAVGARDVAGCVAAVLGLEEAIVAWSTDTLQSDATDRARRTLRSMVVRLGELAERGAADPADAVRPFVETLLELRSRAREQKDYALADLVRDRMTGAGVEVRDTPQGADWELRTASA